MRSLHRALAIATCLAVAFSAGSAAPKKKAKPPGRKKGPGTAKVAKDKTICFAMYTVHKNILKLTAQLYPLDKGAARKVRLEIKTGGKWRQVAEADVVEPGWAASFRVEKWDATKNAEYRVAHGKEAYYTGLIRRDPVDKETIVAAAFTGNSPRPGGGNLSKRDVVDNVAKIDPDVLLFTGDQVYNHNQHTAWWIKFGETFGEIIRSRPTVCIPDDHDVGHANLWGAGGRKTRRDSDGGFIKPPAYVNMVQRAQTSNLPDPYDPTPIQQGITVYYTSLNVGGIDFAIIEDRKFKSGCKGLVTKAMGPRPDHISNKDYDPKALDAPGKKLLGERQLKFLREWGKDWDSVVMKAVVSQTVFSMVQNYHSRGKTFYYADFDYNGWPQTGRDKALREMRRCFAFHISGDQHLGSIVQYGIDEFGDAGYAFCVPPIANLWPRWWLPKTPGKDRLPGAPDYTGKHLDGFGNKMTVYAVSNPTRTGRKPAELHDKAPGFAVVRFNKKRRTITMECWPRMMDPTDPANAPKQYPGWPLTIGQFDNYGRKAAAYLPTLKIAGQADPVVQVINEAGGEVVYTLRISGTSYRPKVFKSGTYTVKVGLGARQKVIKGIKSLDARTDKTIEVQL